MQVSCMKKASYYNTTQGPRCVMTHSGCGIAGMLFGWETVMTFVLVSTVYAVAIGEPSFGVVGPFAVGLSLFAMVFAGECPYA